MTQKGPSKPKLQEPEKTEDIQRVKEDQFKVEQREKRRAILTGGRRKNILSGIQTVLKQRLGD